MLRTTGLTKRYGSRAALQSLTLDPALPAAPVVLPKVMPGPSVTALATRCSSVWPR